MSGAAPSSIAFRDFRSAGHAWWLAVRPRTLGASVVPVLVGLAFASRGHDIDVAVAGATVLAALLLQIATNLANDYYDFAAGIDTAHRLGPVRAAAAGLLPPQAVKRGAWGAVAGALMPGVWLVAHGGLPILAIGAAAAVFAIAYSAGPAPLASLGFGEALAFLFFGIFAVAGTALLQGAPVDATVLLVGLPVAALVTAIMVVNNLRDIPTDSATGKHTLAVRLGDRGTRWLYTGLIAGAFGVLPVVAFATTATALLPLVVLPTAVGEVRRLWSRNGAALNQSLAGSARLHTLFGAAYALGLLP
jgi:1,4-dihydroxy-2-naphthoate octaprenyltransferase